MTIQKTMGRYGVLICGLAAIAVLQVVELPDDSRFSVCMMRRVFGVPCPTCGMTRSVAALAKGQWHRSVAYHPLGPVVAAAMLCGWLYVSWRMARDGGVPALKAGWPYIALAVLGVACLVVWAMRIGVPLARNLAGAQ